MKYPQFRGDEPCVEVGQDFYISDKAREFTAETRRMLVDTCMSCHMLEPCRQWSLHHEGRDAGFWAGMTGLERVAERRRLNITYVDPAAYFQVSSTPRVVHRAAS